MENFCVNLATSPSQISKIKCSLHKLYAMITNTGSLYENNTTPHKPVIKKIPVTASALNRKLINIQLK